MNKFFRVYHNKEIRECSNCKFLYYDSDIQGYVCRRFPQHITVTTKHYCGEWTDIQPYIDISDD